MRKDSAIVLFAAVNYDFCMKQRSHHLADHLSEESDLLYVNPAPGGNSFYGKRLEVWSPTWYTGIGRAIKSAGPTGHPWKLLKSIKNRARSHQLARKLLKYGWHTRKAAIFQFPHHVDQIDGLRRNGFKIIYDMIDDLDMFPSVSEKQRRNEEELLGKSDVVIITSEFLRQKAAGFNDNVVLVPNAVEYDHFTRARVKVSQPSDIPCNGRKNIGYFGAIYEWFDTGLIEGISKTLENNIVLIGDYKDDEGIALKRLKNVFLMGPRDYRELPDYLSCFDVCIIPFKNSRYLGAINPVKVYEYLGGLKPVVCTNLQDISGLPFVFCSRTREEFIDNIKKALESEVDAGPVDRFLENNTWEKRIELIRGILAG